MAEKKNQLASLFAACWKAAALKAHFMSDPKVVLAEYGMDVPDGMDVKMIPAGWMWLPLRQLWFPQSSQLLGTAVSKKERSMIEPENQLASLFAACWKDEALKARFMADPKAVLAEYDVPVPDGMDVKVVENADDCVHITMPAPPSGDLSDDEPEQAAGGFLVGMSM